MSTNTESNTPSDQISDEELVTLLRATIGEEECEQTLELLQGLPSMVELTTPVDEFGSIVDVPEFAGALRSGTEESDLIVEFGEGDLVLQISESSLSGVVPEGWENAALLVQTTQGSTVVEADEDGFFTVDSALKGPFRMMAHHGERTSSTGWLLP